MWGRRWTRSHPYLSFSPSLSPSLPADDFGWGNAGWHSVNDTEVLTPNMNSLLSSGIELNRHYVHMICTPSRTSFQSGRLPVHVQLNLGDPCGVSTGMPRNMTAIPAHLKQAGYATHLVGKWYDWEVGVCV